MIDMQQQNELADALIQKLERIKALWNELPAQDDLEELAKVATNFAQTMKQATDTYLSDEFPTEDAIQELARSAQDLPNTLERAKETYLSDGFPGENDIEELEKAAKNLADVLEEIDEDLGRNRHAANQYLIVLMVGGRASQVVGPFPTKEGRDDDLKRLLKEGRITPQDCLCALDFEGGEVAVHDYTKAFVDKVKE
jgi:tetrahydromethanopterin S-methyltransferase subunit B